MHHVALHHVQRQSEIEYMPCIKKSLEWETYIVAPETNSKAAFVIKSWLYVCQSFVVIRSKNRGGVESARNSSVRKQGVAVTFVLDVGEVLDGHSSPCHRLLRFWCDAEWCNASVSDSSPSLCPINLPLSL